MDFKTLNELVPYAKGGKEKVLRMNPYNGITLALPGRHALDTAPVGGDFCVMVDDDDKKWSAHQFTHTDLFKDLQKKSEAGTLGLKNAVDLMQVYYNVITGANPPSDLQNIANWKGTIHPQTFVYAVQCLAVAEHRRYHQHEAKFGGRYLPFRFSAGIVEGLWDASDAMSQQRWGRPGVERLEKENGVPDHTKRLFDK